MSEPDVFERAARWWSASGIALRPVGPESEIGEVFDKLASPTEVRRLFSAVGGFVNYEYDNAFLSLWSPARILSENSRGNESRFEFVRFADWLIFSHLYCLRYESPERSSVYVDHNTTGVEPYKIADSLTEFLEKLMGNSDDVEAWKSPARIGKRRTL